MGTIHRGGEGGIANQCIPSEEDIIVYNYYQVVIVEMLSLLLRILIRLCSFPFLVKVYVLSLTPSPQSHPPCSMVDSG